KMFSDSMKKLSIREREKNKLWGRRSAKIERKHSAISRQPSATLRRKLSVTTYFMCLDVTEIKQMLTAFIQKLNAER
ncbi:hypothetical protein PN462_20880, partial [Spirulina sp. CS-785/01]|uniref:hypothetical protein n=1 Tax=Spirulina sp. CS-785/01 TaxID=3021716 RepID=UPI00232E4871